ncbi:hypothetical protein DFP72DRAFT_1117511 [Ephemerocybe angulata]|uniref:Uncharacterized protein n=1 Tax=Ephemerocybe angulata TaxID=980116 RepID=A0A8H6M7Q4_9AGAR|nr:hypothetical protein DFP72DRAFT_1117511 [Tulosesus angulatus]
MKFIALSFFVALAANYGMAQSITTTYRGQTVTLSAGDSALKFAANRGAPPAVSPTPDHTGTGPIPNEGSSDDMWLSPPENFTWGWIDDDHRGHGNIDLVWAYEGVPSWDGTKYNSFSNDTLNLFAVLAQVNANVPLPPPTDQTVPPPTRRELDSTLNTRDTASLVPRATVYTCNSNHAALKCDCEGARNTLLENPAAQLFVDGNNRASVTYASCAIVVNTSRPGWLWAYYYQMVADATPIIANCWNGANPCGDYRSGVSQASNTWPKTCVCNNNSQGSC